MSRPSNVFELAAQQRDQDATIRRLKRENAVMREALEIAEEGLRLNEVGGYAEDAAEALRALATKPAKKTRKLSERLASYDSGRKQGPPPMTREDRAALDALGEPAKNPANRTNSGRKRGVNPAKKMRKR
jgi:hypothetical protein